MIVPLERFKNEWPSGERLGIFVSQMPGHGLDSVKFETRMTLCISWIANCESLRRYGRENMPLAILYLA